MPADKAKGRAKGGYARAATLSPLERKSIAATAARARWGTTLSATHKGNFEAEFGIDVECYVLDDPQKSAVISKRGMAAALGLYRYSGGGLPRFLNGVKMAVYVGAELREKIVNPLVFKAPSAVPKEAGPETHGYDVTTLIDICKAVTEANTDGKLPRRYANVVRQAQTLLNASAKVGITNLVYALAGYDATRAEIISAFKLYIREEAREYEREFPEQLYIEWYRLYDVQKPERGKAWKFRHLTVEQVYTPLARSNGQILQLARAQKALGSDRHAKLHQFLSGIGVKALRTHLGQLLGIAQVSTTRSDYERNVCKVFGGQQNLLDVIDVADESG